MKKNSPDNRPNPGNNPLSQAIKAVGVGKVGAREIGDELWRQIFQEVEEGFNNQDGIHIQLSAFLSVYFVYDFDDKSLPQLNKLLNQLQKKLSFEISKAENKEQFRNHLHVFFQRWALKNLPHELSPLAIALQNNEILSKEQAQSLARTILNRTSKEQFEQKNLLKPWQIFCAMSAAIIRFRYAHVDEYFAFYQELYNQIPQKFHQPLNNRPSVILAEPFDGMNKNYFVTPLLADFFHQRQYNVFSLGGTSSGPKFDMNLKDVYHELKEDFYDAENQSVVKDIPAKYFIDVFALCPILEDWKYLRQFTLKRPFLATIEKFFRLFQADIFISSAFHDNFGSIMLNLAESIGYQKICIIRKGREGSLSFSLAKDVEIHLSKKIDGVYQRHLIHFSAQDFFKQDHDDGRFKVGAVRNAELIRQYRQSLCDDDEALNFQRHADATLHGMSVAFDWLFHKKSDSNFE